MPVPAGTIVRLAAPLASGVALWLASPPVGVGWLAWVGLVPAAALALAAPGTRLARLAAPLALVVFLELLLVPALPFGLAEDQWGDPVVPLLVGDSPVLVVALVVVPLFGLLLYAIRFPHFGLTPRTTTARAAVATVLVPGVAWTALDLLRTKFDPGSFWGPLYLSQHDTAAANLAAVAGPWLVTFALVAVNYALALACLAAAGRRVGTGPETVPSTRAVLASAVLALALVAPAAVVDSEPPGRETLRVAAVQPGYDTAQFDLPVNRYLRRETRDLARASLDLVADLTPLTEEAAARGARVAVWPEAAIWVNPRHDATVRTALVRLAQDTGLVVVVPYFLRGPDRGAALAVLPDGTLTRAQGKQRPMWFLGERGRGGEPPEPVATEIGSVGTLLGVDTQEPAPARGLAAAGADFLTSSTHDWEALAAQHAALVRLHAKSLGIPLVRADWRHGSAIVDAGGRVVADTGRENRRAVVVGDVATDGVTTTYARLGDRAGWACVALLGVFLAASAARSRGERAEAERAANPLREAEPAAHPPP
jgi:apolipoprotein N-acyltransferase